MIGKSLTFAIAFVVMALMACNKTETNIDPQTTTPTTNTTTSSSTNAVLLDSSMVLIPANKSFAFSTTTTNATGTESSPINADYYLNKYLVTNAQYKAFCTATSHKVPSYWQNSTYPDGKADHPVLVVSYNDAQAFCDWLNTKSSIYTYRLPTEAEWENAAAGPNKYAYPWGNSADISYSNKVLTTKYNYNGVCSAYYLANYASTLATNTNSSSKEYNIPKAISSILSIGSSGQVSGWKDETNIVGFAFTDIFKTLDANGGFTTPVYAYSAGKSYYGLYDMAGNAWAWTSSLITANNGAEKGQSVNAIRGGSWYANATSCKTNYRGEGRTASGAFNTVGFRVAAVKK